MAPQTIGVLGIVSMLVLLFLGMPIGFTLILVGFAGSCAIMGIPVALPQLHLVLYNMVSNYNWTVLPMFILMGYFADTSGVSSELFETAEKWLRRLPGGLALAAIAGCAAFSGICGSSVATAATMGQVALPAMKKYNYDDGLAAGTVAAGGTLGFLIPPSAALVIYGIIAEQSIGRLLISGYLPGIILALLFMMIVLVRVKINPKLAPRNPEPLSWKERLISLKNTWGVIVIAVLVMGGIYFGFFTPTEGGGTGAFILFLFVLLKRKFTFRGLFRALLSTATVTGMIFIIVYGAWMLNDFMALSRVPIALMETLTGLTTSKYVILFLIVIIYLVLGCFIESIPMIMLTVPVVLPVITGIGFDPVWFGVIIVLMVEAALITPPVGMNVFVITGILKNVPMTTVFRGAVPFVLSIFALVILLAAFPQIALFLPSLMVGK